MAWRKSSANVGGWCPVGHETRRVGVGRGSRQVQPYADHSRRPGIAPPAVFNQNAPRFGPLQHDVVGPLDEQVLGLDARQCVLDGLNHRETDGEIQRKWSIRGQLVLQNEGHGEVLRGWRSSPLLLAAPCCLMVYIQGEVVQDSPL